MIYIYISKIYIYSSFSGILKVKPSDQRLFNQDNDIMEDDNTLQDYGITMSTAKAQAPAQLGLALRYVVCY